MRRAYAAAAWIGGFAVIDIIADRRGLGVTDLTRLLRAEIGPLAFDVILAGAALGYRNHLKRGM